MWPIVCVVPGTSEANVHEMISGWGCRGNHSVKYIIEIRNSNIQYVVIWLPQKQPCSNLIRGSSFIIECRDQRQEWGTDSEALFAGDGGAVYRMSDKRSP